MILKNIEIKASIQDYNKLLDNVENICNKSEEIQNQTDTFFNTPIGRLKLRETDDDSALIYYNRPDLSEPSKSDIAISFTDNPETLKTLLTKSNGIRGIVLKKRILYKYGQTRIHIDDVSGLGKFIELEVVLEENQSVNDGENIANDLMSKLDIQKSDLIDVAYIDLIEKNN